MPKTKTKDNKEGGVAVETPPAKPAEEMQWFSVSAPVHLSGGQKAAWAALGYGLVWNTNEKRLCPPSLARKAAQGGVRLTVPGDHDVDKKMVISPPPNIPTPEQNVARLKKKYAEEKPWVRVLAQASWANGNYRDDFEALENGRPVRWERGEIREIPKSLLKRLIEIDGGEFETDPSRLQEFEGQQARFEIMYRPEVQAQIAKRGAAN